MSWACSGTSGSYTSSNPRWRASSRAAASMTARSRTCGCSQCRLPPKLFKVPPDMRITLLRGINLFQHASFGAWTGLRYLTLATFARRATSTNSRTCASVVACRLAPSKVARKVRDEKVFTNKADVEKVGSLYRFRFHDVSISAHQLRLAGNRVSDEGAILLANIFEGPYHIQPLLCAHFFFLLTWHADAELRIA